jgi:hypothetical protein
MRFFLFTLLAFFLFIVTFSTDAVAEKPKFQVSQFEADITIPIGHACMGGGVSDAKELVDPLYAKGFVLTGLPRPVVVVLLDWCQVNNDSNSRWREVLADAAGTDPECVMLSTVHQHDAPICDLTAQEMLDEQGLRGANCDPVFHEKAVQRVAAALKKSLASPQKITHFGIGRGKVDKVACNRRIVDDKGKITWSRGSGSGNVLNAPDGEIDPWVKAISLWDGDRPVLVWYTYAVHPMSYYGHGGISADFVGMARDRMQKEYPEVFQIYVTGCCGDTTVGKYNEKARPENRPVLAERLYKGMLAAWKSTKTEPLDRIAFRSIPLSLPPRDEGNYTIASMKKTLADKTETRWHRVSAALGLSWRAREAKPIDLPCLELGKGKAYYLILPAEAFVGYALMADRLAPDSLVAVAAFGDGAPGYIPTDQCWKDGYRDHYNWTAPYTDKLIISAMRSAMGLSGKE